VQRQAISGAAHSWQPAGTFSLHRSDLLCGLRFGVKSLMVRVAPQGCASLTRKERKRSCVCVCGCASLTRKERKRSCVCVCVAAPR